MEVEANLFLGAFAGLLGAVIMTILIYLLKAFDYDLDIPYLLGSRFLPIENRGSVYTLGIILHLLAGTGWGALYVFMITAMAVTPNWPIGILWGFGHGIFVGVLMGILSENHPHIGEGRAMSDPGIMGHRWGTAIPYLVLLVHVVFGASSMYIYHLMMT